MADARPTIYLFHGDDLFARDEQVARLLKKQGDSASASMNVQRFSTESAALGDVAQACAALPFLAGRRIILLDRPGRWCGDAERWERFRELLEGVPASTALVLLEPGVLAPKSRLLAWAEAHAPSVYIKALPAPRGKDFVAWVMRRAQSHGMAMETEAAQLLAELVGEDAEAADHELAKLRDYTGGEGPVHPEDVEQLTSFHGQTDIFAMVDALGKRQVSAALERLQRLLQEEDPHYAFVMVIRQFRLLLRAREALDAGQNPLQALGVHPFVAGKVTEQARNFHRSDLERIYRRLMEIDLEDKSGGSQLEATLVGLFAAVAG
jgi:DNA polymerase-3 subunit delta